MSEMLIRGALRLFSSSKWNLSISSFNDKRDEVISFLDIFANKNHVALRLSYTNIQALNYLLRLEIFVSEDGQLRAAHLVLDYEHLSCIF